MSNPKRICIEEYLQRQKLVEEQKATKVSKRKPNKRAGKMVQAKRRIAYLTKKIQTAKSLEVTMECEEEIQELNTWIKNKKSKNKSVEDLENQPRPSI